MQKGTWKLSVGVLKESLCVCVFLQPQYLYQYKISLENVANQLIPITCLDLGI